MIDALLRDGLIAETQDDHRLGDGALLIEDSATGLMLTTLALNDAGLRAPKLDLPGADQTPDTGANVAPTVAFWRRGGTGSHGRGRCPEGRNCGAHAARCRLHHNAPGRRRARRLG